MTQVPPVPEQIASAIAAAPKEAQSGLFALRALILQTAATLPGVGRVEECLKWGQPAFTTPDTKSGSTLRIGVPKIRRVCVVCPLSDKQLCRILQPPSRVWIEWTANRAVLFRDESDIDPDRHSKLIAHGLQYHLK